MKKVTVRSVLFIFVAAVFFIALQGSKFPKPLYAVPGQLNIGNGYSDAIQYVNQKTVYTSTLYFGQDGTAGALTASGAVEIGSPNPLGSSASGQIANGFLLEVNGGEKNNFLSINNANPGTYKLDVTGNTRVSGNVGIGFGSTPTSNIPLSLLQPTPGATVVTLKDGSNNTANLGVGSNVMTLDKGLSQTGAYNNSFVGNVGIGSSVPAQKLDVAGNAVLTGNIGIGTSSPGSKLDVYNITSGNALNARTNYNGHLMDLYGLNTNTGTGLTVDTWDASSYGSTQPALRIKNNSNNIAWFGNNGYIGIGTTAPTQLLTVGTPANGNAASSFYNISANTYAASNSIYSYGYICSQNSSGACTGTSGTVINGGTVQSWGPHYATTYYDQNNSSYYLAPSSSGVAGKLYGSLYLGEYTTNSRIGSLYFNSWPQTFLSAADDTFVNEFLFSSNYFITMRTNGGGIRMLDGADGGSFTEMANFSAYYDNISFNYPLTLGNGPAATYTLDVTGGKVRSEREIIVSSLTGSTGQFRMIGGNYGAFLRNDGSSTYFLLTNVNDPYGSFNGLRPWAVNNATGFVTFGNSHNDLAENYNIIGTVQRGSLVSISDSGKMSAQVSDRSHQAVVGVVSTMPGAVMDTDDGFVLGKPTKQAYTNEKAPVALQGTAPALVAVQNDTIKTGDAIAASSLPGFGQKAIKAGLTVGRALEAFDTSVCKEANSLDSITWPTDDGKNSKHPCFRLPDGTYIGKVMIALGPTWYDPDVALTSTGNLDIVETNGTYQVKAGMGSAIDRIGAFAELVVAKLKVGLIEAKRIVINGIDMESYIKQNDAKINRLQNTIELQNKHIDELENKLEQLKK